MVGHAGPAQTAPNWQVYTSRAFRSDQGEGEVNHARPFLHH